MGHSDRKGGLSRHPYPVTVRSLPSGRDDPDGARFRKTHYLSHIDCVIPTVREESHERKTSKIEISKGRDDPDKVRFRNGLSTVIPTVREESHERRPRELDLGLAVEMTRIGGLIIFRKFTKHRSFRLQGRTLTIAERNSGIQQLGYPGRKRKRPRIGG